MIAFVYRQSHLWHNIIFLFLNPKKSSDSNKIIIKNGLVKKKKIHFRKNIFKKVLKEKLGG